MKTLTLKGEHTNQFVMENACPEKTILQEILDLAKETGHS